MSTFPESWPYLLAAGIVIIFLAVIGRSFISFDLWLLEHVRITIEWVNK